MMLQQKKFLEGSIPRAITLAHEIARHIGKARNRPCLCAYAEKVMDGDRKLKVFKRTAIRTGEKILIVEDALTTGGSVDLTATAVTDAGGIVLPFTGALANRSGLTKVGVRKIVALVSVPMPTWKPADCPLCMEGSEAICPKGAENWARLIEV